MTTKQLPRAERVSANDIASLAAEGLQRASAARQAMSELAADQAAAVSGGGLSLVALDDDWCGTVVPRIQIGGLIIGGKEPVIINGKWGPGIMTGMQGF